MRTKGILAFTTQFFVPTIKKGKYLMKPMEGVESYIWTEVGGERWAEKVVLLVVMVFFQEGGRAPF